MNYIMKYIRKLQRSFSFVNIDTYNTYMYIYCEVHNHFYEKDFFTYGATKKKDIFIYRTCLYVTRL